MNAIYGNDGSYRALKSMVVVSEDGVAIFNHSETVASALCRIKWWAQPAMYAA